MRTAIIMFLGLVLLLFILTLNGIKDVKTVALQQRHIAELEQSLSQVPTFKQLQEMVGAEPDGIIGPETIRLWEKKICDQEYKKMIERMSNE